VIGNGADVWPSTLTAAVLLENQCCRSSTNSSGRPESGVADAVEGARDVIKRGSDVFTSGLEKADGLKGGVYKRFIALEGEVGNLVWVKNLL
jgi:hypothetical protein